jgi:hypothetical protein
MIAELRRQGKMAASCNPPHLLSTAAASRPRGKRRKNPGKCCQCATVCAIAPLFSFQGDFLANFKAFAAII